MTQKGRSGGTSAAQVSAGEDPVRRLRRGSLTAESIVDAAFVVAVATSVEGLTMPHLARHLEVGVTSIYWHFRTKDELLEAMRERAFDKFHALLPQTGRLRWSEQVRSYFIEFRRIFTDDPVLLDLVIGQVRDPRRDAMTSATLRRVNEELAIFVEAGFSIESAVRAYHLLSVYTRGCILTDRQWEVAGLDRSETASPFVSHLPVAAVDRESIPLVLAAQGVFAMSGATDEDFEFGLDVILDGLRRRLAADRRAAKENGESLRRSR